MWRGMVVRFRREQRRPEQLCRRQLKTVFGGRLVMMLTTLSEGDLYVAWDPRTSCRSSWTNLSFLHQPTLSIMCVHSFQYVSTLCFHIVFYQRDNSGVFMFYMCLSSFAVCLSHCLSFSSIALLCYMPAYVYILLRMNFNNKLRILTNCE